jgi:hypothetical protein
MNKSLIHFTSDTRFTLSMILLVVCLLPLFLVLPAFTVVLTLAVSFHNKGRSNNSVGLVIIFISLYLSLINVTKVPESDLGNYIESFNNARTIDFNNFIEQNGREPLYYSFLYFFGNIIFFDSRLYVFVSTLVPYLIFGFAIARLGFKLGLTRQVLIGIIVSLMFFGQLFSLSGHILRQFLASAIVVYIIVEEIVTGKRQWMLAVLAGNLHFSVLLLLGLILIKPIKRFSLIINIVIYLFVMLVSCLAVVYVAPLLESIPFVGVIFQRIVSPENDIILTVSSIAMFVAAVFLWMSVLLLFDSSKLEFQHRFSSLMLATFVLSALVLIATLETKLSEVAIRYFFYLYFLGGPILVILNYRYRWSKLIVYTLALLATPSFFINIAFGSWRYAEVRSLLFNPAWVIWDSVKKIS